MITGGFFFNSYGVRPYLDHGKYKHGISATPVSQLITGKGGGGSSCFISHTALS